VHDDQRVDDRAAAEEAGTHDDRWRHDHATRNNEWPGDEWSSDDKWAPNKHLATRNKRPLDDHWSLRDNDG
jgi:hypothetical protein